MISALDSYMLFWLCILGLCFGSFFNVVILRSLRDESIVFPPSKCPKCNNRLKPWHNIPVLSYVFLGGKCAFCKENISIQYPIIELLTMGLFAWCFTSFGLTWKTLFAITVVSGMLIMTITDIKEKLVDCNIAIGIAIIGILYNGFVNHLWLDSILGLIIGVAVMELLARIGYFVSKERAFGEADTYIASCLGACFGVFGLFQVLIYTLFSSMLFIIPLFLYRQYKNNQKLLCVVFILFVLSTLVYKSLAQNWFVLGLLIILGLLLTVLVLKNVKKDSELLYLPLVPAFFLGTLYFLFF